MAAHDEVALAAGIPALALQHHGRRGCRPATAMLHRDGWTVSVTQVERISRTFPSCVASPPIFVPTIAGVIGRHSCTLRTGFLGADQGEADARRQGAPCGKAEALDHLRD